MHVLTKELEVPLGPDIGTLNIRVGIHSGPVTVRLVDGSSRTCIVSLDDIIPLTVIVRVIVSFRPEY